MHFQIIFYNFINLRAEMWDHFEEDIYYFRAHATLVQDHHPVCMFGYGNLARYLYVTSLISACNDI
jgi:hypothetical protein